MNSYPMRSPLFIAMAIIITLTSLFYGCKDNTLTQGIPPKTDNQTSAVNSRNKLKRTVNKAGVIEGEYIVTFKNQFDSLISDQIASQADQLQNQILSANAIKQEAVLSRFRYAIKGFAAKLDSTQVVALRKDHRIASVAPNIMLQFCLRFKCQRW